MMSPAAIKDELVVVVVYPHKYFDIIIDNKLIFALQVDPACGKAHCTFIAGTFLCFIQSPLTFFYFSTFLSVAMNH